MMFLGARLFPGGAENNLFNVLMRGSEGRGVALGRERVSSQRGCGGLGEGPPRPAEENPPNPARTEPAKHRYRKTVHRKRLLRGQTGEKLETAYRKQSLFGLLAHFPRI